MTDAATLAPGAVIAEKLRIVRALGEGGMGAVFEVEHLFTKHRRALKLLHGQFAATPAVVARFLREASAAGRIGNPHIVETFDAGQLPSGEPYLVMELLSGAPLDRVLQERGRLEVVDAVDVLRQACDGIEAAHRAGIVHRDLKPENLFLQSGERPFVKILDFGISKFDESLSDLPALTTEGSILGTPFYMSPEQVRGERLDVRADVYALGVVLYECLTGRRPFTADNLAELGVRIHEGKCTPLTELRPDVPESLAEVVERAMHVDKSQRFESVAELDRALAALEPMLELASSATIAVPPASFAPEPRAATGPAHTDAAHALSVAEAAPSPKRWPLLALLGALGAAGVGWAIVTRSAHPEHVGAEPSAAAQPSAAEPSSPLVEPVLPVEPAPAPVVEKPDAVAPVAEKSAKPAALPAPKPSARPKQEDRGSKHQIADENPF